MLINSLRFERSSTKILQYHHPLFLRVAQNGLVSICSEIHDAATYKLRLINVICWVKHISHFFFFIIKLFICIVFVFVSLLI